MQREMVKENKILRKSNAFSRSKLKSQSKNPRSFKFFYEP